MRIWKVIAALLMGAALCACGPAAEPEPETTMHQETTTLKIMVYERSAEVYKEIAKLFEEENPGVRVHLIGVTDSEEEVHRIYISAFAGREETIDLFEIEDSYVAELVERGYVSSLDNRLELDMGQYTDKALNLFRYDQKLYALPVDMDMGLLFCRKEYREAIAANRDRIYQFADELGAEGGMALPDGGESLLCSLYEMIAEKDGDISAGLNLLKAIYGQKTSVDFKAGNAVCARGWSSLQKSLSDEVSRVSGNFSILPLSEKDGNPVSVLKGSGLVLNANSNKAETALRFLSFMGEARVYQLIAKEKGSMPVLREFYSDPVILDAVPYIRGMEDKLDRMRTRKRLGNYYAKSCEVQERVRAFLNGQLDVTEAEKWVKQIY